MSIIFDPDEMVLGQEIIRLIDEYLELKKITLEQYLCDHNSAAFDKYVFDLRNNDVKDEYGRKLYKCIKCYCNGNRVNLTDYKDNLKMMVEFEEKNKSN